ncbi:SagB/ThcOx family dehydrogenase [Patescibacteria group bacterium]|nr:SagB/ThcOx family dehydrogenase [Patescibacteria group bacterium]
MPEVNKEKIIALPEPKLDSSTSIEKALLNRRSVRDYKSEALNLAEISQLLWSAQGITDKKSGGRTAPSAGALYPMEIYLVVNRVEGLNPGVYKYNPSGHEIITILTDDKRKELAEAALGQDSIAKAPATIVIVAVPERTRVKYGDHADRFVAMEAGHISQNICLQVISLDLGTVTVGGFDDQRVKKLLNLPENEIVLYLMPVGKK